MRSKLSDVELGRLLGWWLEPGIKVALLVFMLLLALSACGQAQDENGSATRDSAEATQLSESTSQPQGTATETPAQTPTDVPPTTPPPTTEETVTAVTSPQQPDATAQDMTTPTPEATTTPAGSPATQVTLTLLTGGLTRPLYLTHAYDERLFVVEQEGRIKIIADDQVLAEPFLDISDRVGSSALEQGLLSVAFDPGYAENGRFFVNYTDRQGNTVIARFQVDETNPDRANADSEQVLLTVSQPFPNHNGGQLHFGPDGYLYVGMGDGGSAGDPRNNGQDPNTLLGAILRLDVDSGDSYGIPDDNPYVGQDGARGEVWAIGLRNPWRFSFDRLNDDLFVADVGQNLWEEVNYLPFGSGAGANYGWNVLEASHCFAGDSCDSSGTILPVAEYAHQDGNCSITGGHIYRGSKYPELSANYFFADYCSGQIWSLFQQSDGNWLQQSLQRTGMVISSFGEDSQGELYLLDHINGDVYQLGS